MWPFKPKIEERQSGGVPFSDAVVEAIITAAGGTSPADPTAIAALEAAASLYAAAFAAATVTPANTITQAVSPAVRGLIARVLIRRGESLHLIEVNRGGCSCSRRVVWDVRGQWRESEMVVSPGPVRPLGERDPVCGRQGCGSRPICG